MYEDDPTRDVISEEELDTLITNIQNLSREGDILLLEYRKCYISGFGNNRKLHNLRTDVRFGLGYILPSAALDGVRGYGISELRDINRYYSTSAPLDIIGIQIPGNYLIPEREQPENFKFANKEDGIPLNIGENQVIYIAKS